MDTLNQSTPFIGAIAALIGAIAAVLSAATAILAVWFSRQPSTRERIDILKGEILGFVATEQGLRIWMQTREISKFRSKSAYGTPKIMDLAKLLKRKYQKSEWIRLIPAALQELKKDGHGHLLGT